MKDAQNKEIKRIVIATQNESKKNEISEALKELGWEIEILPKDFAMPEENGSTYEENAALKACFIATMLKIPALADDSGLEVEALNNEPGIYSARFGNAKNDLERNLHLLDKMRNIKNRNAKFVANIVLAYPDGDMEVYEGEIRGEILEGPRGQNGFGYDPLFKAENQEKSFAEMNNEEKNKISHRSIALEKLLKAHKK